MTETRRQDQQLCPPRLRKEIWYRCGLSVLERDPTGPEACPSYGGGGMFVRADCMDPVADFLRRAYDARAVRMEHQRTLAEEEDFEPLP